MTNWWKSTFRKGLWAAPYKQSLLSDNWVSWHIWMCSRWNNSRIYWFHRNWTPDYPRSCPPCQQSTLWTSRNKLCIFFTSLWNPSQKSTTQTRGTGEIAVLVASAAKSFPKPIGTNTLATQSLVIPRRSPSVTEDVSARKNRPAFGHGITLQQAHYIWHYRRWIFNFRGV